MGSNYFDTKRLRIHQFEFQPRDGDALDGLQTDSFLFVAIELDNDCSPYPVVTVLVHKHSDLFGRDNIVHWMETADRCRRQGFATEVLQAIEGRTGSLMLCAATDAGSAFIKHYREQRPAAN